MKCALITGASSGIGAEVALEMSNKGYEVILLARDLDRLTQVSQNLPGPYSVHQCDLSDTGTIEKFCHNFVSGKITNRPLKALIHNAGSISRSSFAQTPESEWLTQFHLSVLGPTTLTRGLFQPLISAQARIVTVASTLGQRPVKSTAAYSAMKSAMINWSQSLALELAEYNVQVNCVCPGIIDTPIHGLKDSERIDWIREVEKIVPMKKVGVPKDVAEAIVFYASESAPWTTGNLHNIDGGLSLV